MLTRIAKDKSCKIQAKIFFKRTSYKTQFIKGALELKMHYDNYFIEWKRLQPGNGYYLTSGGGGIEGSLYGEACMTLPPQLGPVEI